jgi:dihydroorotate dehydrogenase (fumarate)
MPDLTTTYLGLTLKNPVIAASSGLTDSLENIVNLEKAGVGAVVLKSLFEEEIVAEMEAKLKQMASVSFLYPETLEFYEDLHEDNASLKYLDLIKTLKSKINIPLIASINCVSSDHWTYFPKQIETAGADALELNIFILPSDFNRDKVQNEKVYLDIIEKVTSIVKIPVAVKLSTYFSDLALTLQKFSQTKISGLVLFNKYYNPDFDIENLEVISGKILSSPDDFHNTLRWISIMAGRVNCSLAATTGIHTGETTIKMLLAGADAVQIASTIYQNGNDKIKEIISFIESWMHRKGYNKITDFKGKLSQLQSNSPAAYERVQFMKYFRGYKRQFEQ